MTAALDGVRVLDISTLFAGPVAATMLGDFGADVIKVEHPDRPDAARGHGAQKGGVNLWWKTLGRNKHTVALNLRDPEGARAFEELVRSADVVIENFRPGTLERWGIGPDRLLAVNPRLVVARVTTYGQFGPRSHEPGFGSLAEALSGFAALSGEPNGPPMLPPFGLADGITALATAFAVVTALRAAERDGEGQVIDAAIIEPIMFLLGGQITAFDQLGVVQPRTGNRSVNNAPRNVYRTSDDHWVAVSTSSQSIAERVMTLVGRADVVTQPWFQTGVGRVAHVDELDSAVADWIRVRPLGEVLAEFARVQAAIAPIQGIEQIMHDPQYLARGTIQTVEDDELGPVKMQNVIVGMSRTPGTIRWAGRPHAHDTDEVLHDVGLSDEQISALRERGVVR